MTKQFLYTLLFAFSLCSLQAQTLTVSASQLNFGVVYENAPDSLQLTINNTLGKTVNVSSFRFYSIYGQSAFSCANSNFIIADGSSQTVWIKFSPQHNIYHNSELVIENNAHRGYVSVDLVGQGRYSKSYYSACENLQEELLKTSLQNITGNGYNSLGYNIARDSMFMWLDNKRTNGQGATQNTLECVYTGRIAVNYLSRSDCQNNDQFNTEHTFPQGFFNSLEPMRSDLHHLFPTDDIANNTRANYPFGIVTSPTWQNGGSKFDNNSNIFEPRDLHKGAAARAMLYFVIRYQNYNSFLNSQESILKTWNKNFLPSPGEQDRNTDIQTIQNNRNPFVDYPQLADRITSFTSTSSAPSLFALDQTQNEINYGFVLNASNNVYNYVIVNNGNQVIQFTNFNLSNTFILNFTGNSGANINLNPGETLTLTIDLHPSIPGVINETVSFQTNVPGFNTIQVLILAQSSLVGIDEIKSGSEIIIYPNPVKDDLVISGVNFTVNDVIKIYNVLGKEVFEKSFSNSMSNRITLSDVNAGVYYLTLYSKGNRVLGKPFFKY